MEALPYIFFALVAALAYAIYDGNKIDKKLDRMQHDNKQMNK